MVDVNIKELSENINNLNLLIDEYDEIQLNLFNELDNSCISWQDGNSLLFNDYIYLDKQETVLFVEHLRQKKEVFDYICERYNDIGKKISCNLNSRTTVENMINNCYNQVNSILREFNKIDNNIDYKEMLLINQQKNKLISIRNQLYQVKKDTINMYDKIEKIEEDIKNKIVSLEEIQINSFDFDID